MIQNSTSNHNGFTLIELMITVVIIGILAAIAYPSYTQYIKQSRRSDAFTALTQLANNLEKFYSQCGAYTTDNTTSGGVNCTTPTAGPGTLGLGSNQSPDGYYTLSIATGTPPYTITATANSGGVQNQDTDCRTLTLDSTGAKTSKNSGGTVTTNCWKK
jgi:type IV pilus assembly protein PilE